MVLGLHDQGGVGGVEDIPVLNTCVVKHKLRMLLTKTPVWVQRHLWMIQTGVNLRKLGMRIGVIERSKQLSLNRIFDPSTPENSESLVKVSVSTTFVQSRSVSVSTTTKLSSLDWSRYRQPWKIPVSKSLGLDNLKISESRLVSVSTTWKILSLRKSRSRQLPYKNNDNFHIKPSISQSYQVTSISK